MIEFNFFKIIMQFYDFFSTFLFNDLNNVINKLDVMILFCSKKNKDKELARVNLVTLIHYSTFEQKKNSESLLTFREQSFKKRESSVND